MAAQRNRNETRVITARIGVSHRLGQVWEYRELLAGMVRKELKVKYKNSVLGFFWSMLNPALYLAVFWVVFTKFLPNGVPQFPIFLLSGLLVWNLFSTALGGAAGSIVGNASIVKKVAFPREILPLASVGASLVHFFLQSVVLFVALIGFRFHVDYSYLPLIVPALIVLLLFAAAFGILLSAINVYLRDTQHFLELALLAWFWMTPIVYPFQMVAAREGWSSKIWQLNPVAPIVLTFQRAIYAKVTISRPSGKIIDPELCNKALIKAGGCQNMLPTGGAGWYLVRLGLVAVFSLVLLWVALVVFARSEGNFAEEL